jgi:hypothetical protein
MRAGGHGILTGVAMSAIIRHMRRSVTVVIAAASGQGRMAPGCLLARRARTKCIADTDAPNFRIDKGQQ